MHDHGMALHAPAGAGPRRTRVCTSIAGLTGRDMAARAREAFRRGTDLVEFRLDCLQDPSYEGVKGSLAGFLTRAVLTVRPGSEGGAFKGGEEDRRHLLASLARLRPAYLDVELRALEGEGALRLGIPKSKVIVSWHDPAATGSRSRLLALKARAAAHGGLVKIVTRAREPADNASVLSLYDGRGTPPVAFCMGEKGTFSRVMAMALGSPIAYASLEGEATAPGQLPLGQMLAVRRRLESEC